MTWAPGKMPALAVLLALAPACASHRPPPPSLPPSPPPLETIASRLSARTGETAIEGLFKIDLQTSGGRRRLNGVLLAQEETGLRVELFSMIGPPVGYVTLTPSHASIFLPLSDRTFLGTESPDEVLAALTGDLLTTSELIGLFLGRLPDCRLGKEVRYLPGDDRFLVDCVAGEGRHYELRLVPDTLLVARVSPVHGQSPERFACELDDYRAVGESRLAFQITLRAGKTFAADIRFSKLAPSGPFDEGVFELQPPPGAHEMPLESVLLAR